MTDRARPSLDELGRALAEPMRLRVLRELLGGTPLPAGALAARIGVAPSTVSAHLARLADAGLIEIENVGRAREASQGLMVSVRPREHTRECPPALAARPQTTFEEPSRWGTSRSRPAVTPHPTINGTRHTAVSPRTQRRRAVPGEKIGAFRT